MYGSQRIIDHYRRKYMLAGNVDGDADAALRLLVVYFLCR